MQPNSLSILRTTVLPLCMLHFFFPLLFYSGTFCFCFLNLQKSKSSHFFSNHCHLQLTGRALPQLITLSKTGQYVRCPAGHAFGREGGEEWGWAAGKDKAGICLERRAKLCWEQWDTSRKVKKHMSHTLKAESWPAVSYQWRGHCYGKGVSLEESDPSFWCWTADSF